MSKKKRRVQRDATTELGGGKEVNKQSSIAFLTTAAAWDTLCVQGYTSLDRCPEIITGCLKVAEILASATIRLMENTKDGDRRILNALSRRVDIDPMPNMTRQTWMTAIVMNLLLYGKGNSIVVPHTRKGLLDSLEPISADRVILQPKGYDDYSIIIDGTKTFQPDEVCHFVYNPDKTYMWMGKGIEVSLRDFANNLKQAGATTKAFMTTEYKPSIIVKVDSLTDEFASPSGRQKLVESYINPSTPGEPWIIPAEQFQVEQVKPLTLADLAISDQIELDKRAVASIIGVPPFVLGVGAYNKEEWNYFIQTKIMGMAKSIAQELTKKILISNDWYWELNIWSMLDYNIEAVSQVLLEGADRGFVNGDEWRDRMHMNPAGLKEYKILENYIPYDKSGDQSKLQGE